MKTPHTRSISPRFTASAIGFMAPGDHTDSATQGLQLRVRAHSRTWLFRYMWEGKAVRVTIGHFPATSLDLARTKAGALRKAFDAGIDPRRSKARSKAIPAPLAGGAAVSSVSAGYTVDFLCTEFKERYLKVNHKTDYVADILDREVLKAWRGRDARSIEPGEVIDLLDTITDRGANPMANRTANAITKLFDFGIQRRIVERSPVHLIMAPGGKEKKRKRFWSEVECRTFLAKPTAATRYKRLAHILTLLLLTGQRRGELAKALWSNVDLKRKVWLIPDHDAKMENGHELPLSDWAVDEFRALKGLAGTSIWVLPGIKNNRKHMVAKQITRGVAKCQKRFAALGIKHFTAHDLRRTCRTGLSRLKVPKEIAERILNHFQDTYDQWAFLDEKRAALDRWAAHLSSLIG